MSDTYPNSGGLSDDDEEEGGFPAVCTFRYRPKEGVQSPKPDESGFVVEQTTFHFDLTSTTGVEVVEELYDKLLEEGHTPEAPRDQMALYVAPSDKNEALQKLLLTTLETNQQRGGGGEMLVELETTKVLAEMEIIQDEMASEAVVRFMVAKTTSSTTAVGGRSPVKMFGKWVVVPGGIETPPPPTTGTTPTTALGDANGGTRPTSSDSGSPNASQSTRPHFSFASSSGGEDEVDWNPSFALRIEPTTPRQQQPHQEQQRQRSNEEVATSSLSFSKGADALSPRNKNAALKSPAALDALEGDFPGSGGRIKKEDFTVADIEAARILVDSRELRIKEIRKVVPGRRHWTRDLGHLPGERELLRRRKVEEVELGKYLSSLEEESPKFLLKLEMINQETVSQQQLVSALAVTLQSKAHVGTKKNSLEQEVSSLKGSLAASTEREKVLRESVGEQQTRLKSQVRAMSSSPPLSSSRQEQQQDGDISGHPAPTDQGAGPSSSSILFASPSPVRHQSDGEPAELDTSTTSGTQGIDSWNGRRGGSDSPITGGSRHSIRNIVSGGRHLFQQDNQGGARRSGSPSGIGFNPGGARSSPSGQDITVATANGGSPVISQTLSDVMQSRGSGLVGGTTQRPQYDGVGGVAPGAGGAVSALSVSDMWTRRSSTSAQPQHTSASASRQRSSDDDVSVEPSLVPPSAWKGQESATARAADAGESDIHVPIAAERTESQTPLPAPQQHLTAQSDVSELLSPDLRRDVLKMLDSGMTTTAPIGSSSIRNATPTHNHRHYAQQQQQQQFTDPQPQLHHHYPHHNDQQQQYYHQHQYHVTGGIGGSSSGRLPLGAVDPARSPAQMKILANDLSAFLDSDGGDLATRRLLLSKVQAARRSMDNLDK